MVSSVSGVLGDGRGGVGGKGCYCKHPSPLSAVCALEMPLVCCGVKRSRRKITLTDRKGKAPCFLNLTVC